MDTIYSETHFYDLIEDCRKAENNTDKISTVINKIMSFNYTAYVNYPSIVGDIIDFICELYYSNIEDNNIEYYCYTIIDFSDQWKSDHIQKDSKHTQIQTAQDLWKSITNGIKNGTIKPKKLTLDLFSKYIRIIEKYWKVLISGIDIFSSILLENNEATLAVKAIAQIENSFDPNANWWAIQSIILTKCRFLSCDLNKARKSLSDEEIKKVFLEITKNSNK